MNAMSANRVAAAADLAVKLAALSEMASDDLRDEWRRLYRSQPPKRTSRHLMVLAISWKLQERVYGGLTAAQKRKLAGLADELRENGDLSGGPAIRVKPGSKLVREWRGETHTVLVLEDGFEWQGKRHPSLSSIAREITGTQWSGPRFFGLRRKPRPFSGEEQADA
jgi:hypothetical protein